MFPCTELVASGLPVLITDQLDAPADFLLHRIVTSHLKDDRQNRCILFSISSDLPRWKAISAKSNVNLDQHITSGSFQFVDLVPFLQPPNPYTHPAESPLISLSKLLSDFVGGPTNPEVRTLVVFDDASSLEWLGHATIHSTRFVRFIFTLCRKANSSLFIRYHVPNREEPDDLLRHLLQVVAYHTEVCPLSSGKSGAVSGEVALHSGPTLGKEPIRLIPRKQALQYRLTDYGVVFFDKGTCGGVL